MNKKQLQEVDLHDRLRSLDLATKKPRFDGALGGTAKYFIASFETLGKDAL